MINNYIFEMAKPDKHDRFNAIIKVLKENDVSYKIQSLPFSEALGNIIVTFGENNTKKRIVVSAHYDNISGMPGANDNAAACSILLNLILDAKANGTDKYLEFVFFDLEERGFLGSKYYLMNCLQKKNMIGVINLDMCGLGNNTVVSFHNGFEKDFFVSHNDDVRALKMLPPGDAYTFINAGVPTAYIINSTDRDLKWFYEFSMTGKPSSFAPEFLYTMHNLNDVPDICNLEQIEKIYQFVHNNIFK